MFRPARNRNSPGDPPPKWATIGRAGRLALVITVIVGVVIALVIIGARSADAADAVATPAMPQEPSPPPWFGGRVEMPEYGFAVTVPDGWIAFDLEGRVVAQVEAVQAHAAETPTESLVRLRSTLLAVSAVGGPLLALELSDIVKQSCSFRAASLRSCGLVAPTLRTRHSTAASMRSSDPSQASRATPASTPSISQAAQPSPMAGYRSAVAPRDKTCPTPAT